MSALIPLARVQFREPIAVPGVTEEGKAISYPTHEAILLSTQLPQTRTVREQIRFELWLDTRVGHIIVTHPKSGETERVPMSLVQQVRYLDDVVRAKEVA